MHSMYIFYISYLLQII